MKSTITGNVFTLQNQLFKTPKMLVVLPLDALTKHTCENCMSNCQIIDQDAEQPMKVIFVTDRTYSYSAC